MKYYFLVKQAEIDTKNGKLIMRFGMSITSAFKRDLEGDGRGFDKEAGKMGHSSAMLFKRKSDIISSDSDNSDLSDGPLGLHDGHNETKATSTLPYMPQAQPYPDLERSSAMLKTELGQGG